MRAASNDIGREPPDAPEHYGRAALLLVESLLHALISRSVITVHEAVEVLDTASEVEADRLIDSGTFHADIPNTLTLLLAIRDSLAHDLPAD